MTEHIYFYRLTADTGFAPCVDHGLLSLACCKGGAYGPKQAACRGMRQEIGRKYQTGVNDKKDVVYVVGVSKNTIIYFAKLDAVVDAKDYFTDPQYAHRPDCIYDVESTPVRRIGRKTLYFKRNKKSPLFHPKSDQENHVRDELGGYVLLAHSFAYFGAESEAHSFEGFEDVVPCNRGHRSFSTGDEGFARAKAFLDRYWKGRGLYVCDTPRDKLIRGCKECYTR